MTPFVQGLCAVAAIVVAFWPQVRGGMTSAGAIVGGWFKRSAKADPVSPVPAAPEKETPSYLDAVYHLAQVRARLRGTDALDDPSKQALDSLVLALSKGSDL